MSEDVVPGLPSDLQAALERTTALHEHLCPRQVIGVRMGMLAGELLEMDLPRADKRLVVFAETDGCFADGVSAATNCWIGRRTLRVMDYGKPAATFVDTVTERAIRIWPHSEARQAAIELGLDTSSRWRAQLLGYQVMAAERLFVSVAVELTVSLAELLSVHGLRVACVACGEEIINQREVVLGGQPYCRACAGQGYCRPVAPATVGLLGQR